MGRLIVLGRKRGHCRACGRRRSHRTATASLAAANDDERVVAATTRAEILVGPSRVGGVAFATARNFVDGCATIAVTASIADDTAALRARQRTLSLPDAIALVVANLIDADAAWTF